MTLPFLGSVFFVQKSSGGKKWQKIKNRAKKSYNPFHDAVYKTLVAKNDKKVPPLLNIATKGFMRHWSQKTVVFFYFSVAPLHYISMFVFVLKSSFFFAFLPLFNFLCSTKPYISTFFSTFTFEFICLFFCHFFSFFCHLNRVTLSYQRFIRFFIFCHFFCHFSFFLPLLNPKEKKKKKERMVVAKSGKKWK